MPKTILTMLPVHRLNKIKKSSFTILPVHELSKIKKVVHCTFGGGGGGGRQSLIKVRGSDSKVFTWSGTEAKMLPRADTKSHFWYPRADTIPHFDSKIKKS